MSPILAGFFVTAVVLRMVSLAVSRRNERRLQAAGAVEHGAGTSNALAALHTFFYLGCAAEGLWRDTAVDAVSFLGMALFAFGMTVLAWVVVSLRDVWTVRVFLAPDHPLHRGWLFRAVRHPNYFLNLGPELLGLGLALHAWIAMAVLLPVYVLVLRARIRQEERAMRERFPEYGRRRRGA